MTTPSEPTRALARRMIRSLTRGTTVSDGAQYIHVGHEKWVSAQRELLEEISEDGGSETKFVRGAYGSGKSHFLAIVQDIARRSGWATAHVECKADGVQIDRFETLYPKLAEKLRTKDSDDDAEGEAGIDPVRALLERWSRMILLECGLRDGAAFRPFDSPNRIYARLQDLLGRSNLPSDFVKCLVCFALATEAGDHETKGLVSEWMKGRGQKVGISRHYLREPAPRRNESPKDYFELRPLVAGTAAEALKGLLWLIRSAGYAGLVLCIDEIEELAKLPTRKRRDQALQALREHVDNAGGDSGYRRLCLYLAATPAMFEDQDYFPRYDALQTRIHPVSDEINWRAPVIDLDRTPLDLAQMKLMANRIRVVHEIAYGAEVSHALLPSVVEALVEETVRSRFRVAKPRLLARVVVDELERARQSAEGGTAYRPPTDTLETVRKAAEASQ